MRDRQLEVDAVYTMKDPDKAKAVIEKYGIDYIYIGPFEEEAYGDTLARDALCALGEICYELGEVCIVAL